MADANAGVQTPPAVPETPEVPNYQGTKHRLKVSGQEIELPYEEVIARAQKYEGSERRFQEANQLKRTLEQAWASSDPEAFFKAKQLDPEAWAEQVLIKKIKLRDMSPEQRQEYEKQKAKELQDKDRETELEKLRAERDEAIRFKVHQDLEADVANAFKEANEPLDPFLIKRMAAIMEAHLDEHGQFMKAADALKQAKSGNSEVFVSRLQAMSAKDLREHLSKKQLDELRKHDVDMVRSQSPMRGSKESNGATRSTPPGKTKRVTNTDKFFDMIGANLKS